MQKVLKGVRNAEIVLTGLLFVTALVVLTANVLFRRIPWLPALNWAEEYMRYCSVWITFVGMALCAEDNLHVGVDILYQMSPTRAKKILKILCMAAACVFCALFTASAVKYVMMAMANGTRSPVMRVPLWIIYLALPIGSALSTLQYLLKTVFYVRVDHRELEEKPEDGGEIDLLKLS